MKSTTLYVLIAILFLIPNLLVSEGWIRINPKQYGPSLNDVAMLNHDTIIAVGVNGTIISTYDGGNTWNISDSVFGFSSTFNGIFFRDQKNGYVVGRNGIVLKTNNAGITWNSKTLYTHYDDVILNDIFFTDSLNGFISGYEYDHPTTMQEYYIGALWSTNNGGENWRKVDLPVEWMDSYTNYYTKLYFMNADTGWYYGKGDSVFKTIDGGNNWQKTPWIYNYNFVDLFFISQTVGWSLADQSLYKTYDGGLTWSKMFEVSDKRLNEIYFKNENEGILIGSTWYYSEDNSRIWKTFDGGNSWQLIYTGNENLTALDIENNNGWIVGAHSIKLSTVDWGNTWNSEIEKPFTRENLYETFFVDSLNGWAIGFHGVVLKTIDGGKNWSKSNLDISGLKDVYFTNKDIGWIVGRDGYAFSTKDGGNTWQKRKISEDFSLNSIYFISERIGWIVSDNIIYMTSDEGKNWSTIGPSFIGITDIFFINEKTGWLVTYDVSEPEGKVYRTVDGGQDWSLLYTSDSEGFLKIQFVNKDKGWIQGSKSLFRTIDGGKHWKKINVMQSSEYSYPGGFFFIDEWTGWYCSQHIFKTLDGGDTWTIQQYEYSTFLNDIYFTSMSKGCIVGSDGTLLITNDGGGEPYFSGPLPPQRLEVSDDNFVINLVWRQSRENDVIGYNIYGSPYPGQDSLWISMASRSDTSVSFNKLPTFLKIDFDSIYYFKVKAINRSGEESNFSNQVEVIINFPEQFDRTVEKFSIYQNFPNPFNSITNIFYYIPVREKVSIKIYNILGKLIHEEIQNINNPGLQRYIWDGKNIQGRNLASGIYIYTIIANNERKSKKMILLR